jgi:hypothetical protein
MTDHNQKNEILETLNSLDQAQTDKVMDYIKGLLYVKKDETYYQKFKQEALREIRQALSKKRKFNSAF